MITETFPCFLNLPEEPQILIWNHALFATLAMNASSNAGKYYSEIICGVFGLRYMHPILDAGPVRRKDFP